MTKHIKKHKKEERKRKVPDSVASALDTIAHYLSKQWPWFYVHSDFYNVTFEFTAPSDLDDDEIKANDEFWVLPSTELWKNTDV